MFLDVPGDGVEVLGALVSAQLAPRGEGFPRRLDRFIDIFLACIGKLREVIAVGGVGAGQIFARFRLDPVIVDKQPELALVRIEPRESGIRRFGRWAVGHGLKNLGY